MKTTIFESGMSFITPDKECLFYIEQSGLYKKVHESRTVYSEFADKYVKRCIEIIKEGGKQA